MAPPNPYFGRGLFVSAVQPEFPMYHSLLLPDLRQILAENDQAGLTEFCEALYPAVTAEVLEGLEPEETWRVLSGCNDELQAEIFQFFSLAYQVDLVKSVDRKRLSKLIESMAADNRVDLLERMDPEAVEELLPLVAQAERSDIRKLLSYPEDSAGSIMTTEYASLPEQITVAQALDKLRKQAPNRETIYYIYIIDEGRRLHGFISLRELILAKPHTLLSDIMQRDVISVRVDDDQEFVAQELGRYDFLAIPVVDNQNRLVGIITHDDVLDVIREEATEDAQRLGAVEPFEDSYLTTPLQTLAWKRGIWLVILLGAAFATAAVLNRYESVSEKYEWLVLFIPLVLASGGNAGSQSATLVIRTLALGEITRRENILIARREIVLAAMLGGCLMLLGFTMAAYFVTWYQAAVVGLTLLLVVLVGTMTGAMLPVVFRGLGMDPALMSNPLIASLVDVTGIVIYYNVALIIMRAMEP